MTRIIDFYKNNGSPYYIKDILDKWTYEDWENKHDFIQWIFPTSKKSMYNPNAPLLDNNTAKYLIDNEMISVTILLNKFMLHLLKNGLLNYENHNWLRITRVIQFLRELGKFDTANTFLDFCKNFTSIQIPEKTLDIWNKTNKLEKLL